MDKLKPYEITVIQHLTAGVFSPDQCETIVREVEIVGYEYSGSGYFLTLRHSLFPQLRTVCDRPFVKGHYEKEDCGFVIFLEKGELLLECHTWGEVDISESFRNKDVEITTRA
jgi:hypothetical protein